MTPPTSCMARISRGFTLIELMVVIAGLTLIASIAMPNLWRARESIAVANFLSDLRSFGTECRDRAITGGQTLALTYDESGQILRLHTDSGEEQDGTNVASLSVPPLVSFQGFRVGTDDSTSSEWAVRFYPDGRSDGGGFEALDNGRVHAWVVQTNGSVVLQDGSYPDQSQQNWAAGEYERRL